MSCRLHRELRARQIELQIVPMICVGFVEDDRLLDGRSLE